MSDPAPSELFDPGLQPERTGLAWRRTAMALAVGSLAALRILPAHAGGPVGLAPGLLGIVTSIVLLGVGERRYRSAHRRLITRDRSIGGGGAQMLTALCCTALGVGALVVVLS